MTTIREEVLVFLREVGEAATPEIRSRVASSRPLGKGSLVGAVNEMARNGEIVRVSKCRFKIGENDAEIS